MSDIVCYTHVNLLELTQRDSIMPDGDITHPTLNRRFLSVYGQICEGHWESSILGYRLLHPLKGQIINYGNAPVGSRGKERG